MKKYNEFISEGYYDDDDYIVNIESFLGKTFSNVEQIGETKINFETIDGEKYSMYHQEDCSEWVSIDDINGDLKDLIGSPILQAKKATNSKDIMGAEEKIDDSFTWTFYKLATIKGYVVIRWLGSSNGYYSEEVTIFKQ